MEFIVEKSIIEEEIFDKNKINVVFYHGHCSDGFGSAFIIWYYYKLNYGIEMANSIKYIPCYYQKDLVKLSSEFIEQITNKNVIMCDFSYKYNQLQQIISASKTFMILDHHKTAESELKNIPDNLKIFDMNRSGVGITWDYFFPNQLIPKFLAHIQDRDIWTFKIPRTSEFISYLFEQDFNFSRWEKFMDETNVDKAIEIGRKWSQYQKIMFEKIIKKASYVIQNIDGKLSIVVYCNSSEFKSDIGNKIFNHYPFADFSCVWDFCLYKNETNYSLRSTNNRYDVSVIAAKFNGGGHRNASGLSFTGVVGCLPYDIMNDYGILELFTHNYQGITKINGFDQICVLFKPREINSRWFKPKYFDLLRRKFNTCNYFVFETETKQYLAICNKEIYNADNNLIFSSDEMIKFFEFGKTSYFN
ncbi:DHH family phosphohydrolase-like protein [Cotonvirus japonicus]|uniref:DHH family phosphohydrolase-like protein n=1 Tax=Cotonvirus japonicus TaxID=2811091 RepID=A0ABM7NR50_9VIRU|nr:DHH family phosphohydrolase-like protein [Cotonvirus japonicus]BCS82631.1 DHH family phosphohydrolase-like protein [Cotonvirus japonicus]